jgi:hypothetical protein
MPEPRIIQRLPKSQIDDLISVSLTKNDSTRAPRHDF